MERYSTAGLPASGRTEAWNALYSSRMSRVEFTPADQLGFDAELSIGQIGPVKLAKLAVDRCSVERKSSHILRDAPQIYNVLLQASGNSTFYHCGREASLAEGDVVLVDTRLPHRFATQGHSVTIMVRIPRDVLCEYLPAPEQFCGLHLGRGAGLTSTLAEMVRSLSDQVAQGVRFEHETRLARYMLEMISLSYAMGFEGASNGSPVLLRRWNDVVRYVEDNLRDPDLSPASIATGMRLSPRYLRTVFAVSGEKISAYILRRRLEECARQLRDPVWQNHTLTEIAFSWGFNSAAHFTRSFRDQFGVAPRDYRRAPRA